MYLTTQNNGHTKQLSIYSGYRNAQGEIYVVEKNYKLEGKEKIYLEEPNYLSAREGANIVARYLNFEKIDNNNIIKENNVNVTDLVNIIESNQAGTQFSINGEKLTILSEDELRPILAKTYSRG